MIRERDITRDRFTVFVYGFIGLDLEVSLFL